MVFLKDTSAASRIVKGNCQYPPPLKNLSVKILLFCCKWKPYQREK